MFQQMTRCKERWYLGGRGVFVCEVVLPGGAYLDFGCILLALLTQEAAGQQSHQSLAVSDDAVRLRAGEECREDAAVC